MARPKPDEPNIPYTVSVLKSLKEAFVRACREADQQGSQVMRAAMREYVAAHAKKAKAAEER